MPQFRIVEIADVLGVSDDTVRRWIDNGELTAAPDGRGRRVVDGESAARLAQSRARGGPASGSAAEPARTRAQRHGSGRSSRNRFVGLVTGLERGAVMCRVELLCGDVTVESLISTEAADELGLEPGTLAVASVKATQVIVERA